jgi:hypothetical protein
VTLVTRPRRTAADLGDGRAAGVGTIPAALASRLLPRRPAWRLDRGGRAFDRDPAKNQLRLRPNRGGGGYEYQPDAKLGAD